jgi:hypothetical protein
MGKDIFGKEIELGTVIAFVGWGARINVAVVESIMMAKNGRLIGYRVVCPHTPKGADHYIKVSGFGGPVIKKTVSASRELIAIPASWLGGLESSQASQVPKFVNRLQYLIEIIAKRDAKLKG